MSEQQVETQETSRALNIRLVIGVLAAAALALFFFQNTEKTNVEFLWMDWSIPLYLLLLITVGLTLVLSVVVTWFLRRRS